MKLIYKDSYVIIDIPEEHFTAADELNLSDLSETMDFNILFEYFRTGTVRYKNQLIEQLDLLDLLRYNRNVFNIKEPVYYSPTVAEELINRMGATKLLKNIIADNINIPLYKKNLIIDCSELTEEILTASAERINPLKVMMLFDQNIMKVPFVDMEEFSLILTVFDRHISRGFELPKCSHLRVLNIADSDDIDISMVIHSLEVLDVAGSNIDDAALVGAKNLRVLIAAGCENLTTIEPFVETLEELDASSYCNIQNCIPNKLTKLSCDRNRCITYFSETLEELDISNTNINDSQIYRLTKLRKLDVTHNHQITNLEPFADTLEELTAMYNGSLTDNSLKCLKNIIIFNMGNNRNITNIDSISHKLIELDISDNTGFTDEHLKEAVNLCKLNVSNCPHITSVEPFKNTLENLNASGPNCGITDASLANATYIRILNCSSNRYITTIAPFAKTLRELSAQATCGLTDLSLIHATKLQVLNISCNDNISTIDPFTETLEEILFTNPSINLSRAKNLKDKTCYEKVYTI